MASEPNSITPDAGPAVEPITEHGTGNALVDGYTCTARRLRGDMPGDMIPEEMADRIEGDSYD